MLPKVGGSGAALFDYARGGPQFGADGLLIGPPLAPVMGGFSGPDTNSGVGDLHEARSRLGLSYSKRDDGKDSLFGEDRTVTLVELEIFCCPAIARLYWLRRKWRSVSCGQEEEDQAKQRGWWSICKSRNLTIPLQNLQPWNGVVTLTVFCLETMQLAPRKSLKGVHSKLALENIRQSYCSTRTEREQRWWKKVEWIVKLSIRKDSALHVHQGLQETDGPHKMTKDLLSTEKIIIQLSRHCHFLSTWSQLCNKSLLQTQPHEIRLWCSAITHLITMSWFYKLSLSW